MQQASMEESLKRLIDDMPLDIPFIEPGCLPSLTDTPELRFGFRRGWQERDRGLKDQLRPLFDAYREWSSGPHEIDHVLVEIIRLAKDGELNDDGFR